MIYSFDIFDTIMARRSLNHLGMFAVMARKLAKKPEKYGVSREFASKFYGLRKLADTEAAKELEREAKFEDLYNFIAGRSGLDETAKRKLMDLEIETELALFEPIPENVGVAEDLAARGEKVVFLSDMYHSPETLRRFISKVSPRLAECDIMVSAYEGGTKGAGLLFEKCLQKYGIKPEEMTHFGDHPHADYDQPISMGIKALPRYGRGDSNYFSEYLSKYLEKDPGLPICLGASRICDLANHFSGIAKIGAYIAGPLLFGFIDWVLRTALRGSRNTLFFLARDGFVLYEIAKKIAASRGYPVNLRYLHVSRLALYRASVLTGFSQDHLDFAFMNDGAVKLADLAERLCVPAGVIKAECEAANIALEEGQALDDRMLDQIREVVISSPEILHAALKASARERSALLAYLAGEGFDFAKACLVDVGWKGSIQDALWEIGEFEEKKPDLSGLYFGINVPTPWVGPVNTKEGFIINPGEDGRRVWIHDGVFMFIEIFCHQNRHGLTKGYAFDGRGKGCPLHDEVLDVNHDFLKELHKGVDSFVDAMLAHGEFDGDCQAFLGYYLRMLQQPSKEMAEILGEYKHFEGIHDSTFREFAPKLTEDAINRMAETGTEFQTSWWEGSLKRSDPRLWDECYGDREQAHKPFLYRIKYDGNAAFFEKLSSCVADKPWIVIFARYPNPELLNDGMYRRIKAVDDILADYPRIYVHHEQMPEQKFHIPSAARINKNTFSQALDFSLCAHQLHFAQLVSRSMLVYAHTGVHSARYLTPYLKTGKVILDAHGVASEEWLMAGRPSCAKFWNGLEREMILGCKNVIVVTRAMARFYHDKYGAPLDKFIHMPIFAEHDYKRPEGRSEKTPTIIYAGGTHPWQNVDLMLETARNFQQPAEFVFLSNDAKTFRDKLAESPVAQPCLIEQAPPAQMDDWYAKADYGFVLRDDDPVNNVAFPTKLMEYIQTGVVPILKTSRLGDVEEYGIKYLSLEDVNAGGLPTEEERRKLAAHNLAVIPKLRQDYKQGESRLLNVVENMAKAPPESAPSSALYPDYMRNTILPMYFTVAYVIEEQSHYQSVDLAEFPFRIDFTFHKPGKIQMFAIICNTTKMALMPPVAAFSANAGIIIKKCRNSNDFPHSGEDDMIYSGDWIYFDCPIEESSSVRIDLEITLFGMETLLARAEQ